MEAIELTDVGLPAWWSLQTYIIGLIEFEINRRLMCYTNTIKCQLNFLYIFDNI